MDFLAILHRHLEILKPHIENHGSKNFMPGSSCSPQVGVVQYGERVVHEFHLDDFQTVDEVVSAAQNIIQRGGEETRTALGIDVARYTKSRLLENVTLVWFIILTNLYHQWLVNDRNLTLSVERILFHLNVICSSQAFKRGGRPDARKVMIVITDGESHDSPDLKEAVEESEKDNITLYGIAVSLLYHPFAIQFKFISHQIYRGS